MPYSLFCWKANDSRNANIDLSFIFYLEKPMLLYLLQNDKVAPNM